MSVAKRMIEEEIEANRIEEDLDAIDEIRAEDNGPTDAEIEEREIDAMIERQEEIARGEV